MKVSLTKHFDRYVTEKIASGRYESQSEVIREALPQMEEREQRDEPASLQAKIAAGFEFYRVGDASRIGYGDNPRLAGVRIGPYSFPARRKGSFGPYTHELRIETRIAFLDKAGREVLCQKAVDVREDVTAITIRPLPPAEYFTPTPD